MKRAIRKCAFLASLACAALLQAHMAGAASSVYATIETKGLGVLKGDANKKGLEDKTIVLKYEYGVTMPAGRQRVHGPVKITKAAGPASPQLFQALITNDEIKSLVIDFLAPNAAGQEVLVSTVRLTKCRVIDFRQVHTAALESSAVGSVRQTAVDVATLEEVTFSVGTIEVIHHLTRTSAMDSVAVP